MTSVITSPMTRMRGGQVIGTRPAQLTPGPHGDSPEFASLQQFHEIAPAAESLLERCDVSCLFGGGAQAAHASDEPGGLLVSAIAASVCEFIDALRIDAQSFAREVRFAGAR